MPRAFTLIELLVVVTIIVVLLALLAPSLDQAIYQAELATCGARLHALGMSVMVYTGEYKRRYPFHQVYQDPGMRPIQLNWSFNGYDDRPLLSRYMTINGHLVCPLTEAVGLEAQENDADTQVFTSYEMWFGWKYQVAGAGQGLLKLGDRLGWNGFEFDTLASDMDSQEDAVGYFQSAHPDKDGRLVSLVGRNVPNTVIFKFTASWWASSDPASGRGAIDRNFTLTDGSVQRFDNLLEGDDPKEKRVVDVPHRGSNGDRWRGYLPPR